ncbi:hypothetical protein [Alicyclobacillus sp.]|uniref:hypothetical protein n=1 Tax=Alicyclobacillus sp. TaxID=61169 RepID=UPI0025C1B78F|nr:hypothetical protein [Alicyclobacillus sp.]MCL6517195.1 hypothetical protein [Alicyclobacillus sp.]
MASGGKDGKTTRDGGWALPVYTAPRSNQPAPADVRPSVLYVNIFDPGLLPPEEGDWLRAVLEAGYRPILVDDGGVYCVRDHDWSKRDST